MVSAGLVTLAVIAIGILFVSMVLSSMASADASKSSKMCKKYSTWAALVTGLSVAFVVVFLVWYIYTSKSEILGAAHQKLAKYAK